jgi:hypothetical protein
MAQAMGAEPVARRVTLQLEQVTQAVAHRAEASKCPPTQAK